MTTMHTWAFGALLALSTLAPRAEEELKPGDTKKLGKAVADYFEAKDKSEGIDKAYQDIAEDLDKIEKKLDGRSALTLVEDWEQIFFEARSEGLTDPMKIRKGKPHEATASLPGGGELSFAVSVPNSYNPRKGPYPFFLVIGGVGKSPLGMLEGDWNDAGLLGEAIVVVPKMPDDPAVWGEIRTDEGQGGIATVMNLYGQFLRQFPIDMDRVFLIGENEGAPTAGRIAGYYPHLFAGLVTKDATAQIDATNFRSLPSLTIGETDAAKALVQGLEGLGYEGATTRPSATAADVWSWAQEQQRTPYPDEVVFAPLSAYATTAYWLSVDGVDLEGGARVDARADRDANRIVIDAHDVSTLRLFFNDRLVDMDRPVEVVVNGVAKTVQLERNRRLMLDLVYQLGDWGRVFTNRMSFDVPQGDESR